MALSLVKGGGDKTFTVQGLEKKRNLARSSRRVFEKDWLLNLAYIQGEQYVTYAYDANRLIELDLPADQEKAIENRCAKITRVERAKLMKSVPVPIAIAPDETQEAEANAKILSGYLKWLQREWMFERRLRTALFWTVATGNVFFKWYWDAQTKMPRMSIIPPFDVYPDPYARTMLDCRYMFHANFMDVDQAKEVYGVNQDAASNVFKESSTEQLNTVESRVYTNYSDGQQNLPGVLVYEYWNKPSPSNPEGDYVVYTKHGIAYQGPFPYAHGQLPFTHIGHIERSNSKWYSSIIDTIRPLQDELNRTASQLIENRNLAQGKWYIPPGLELKEMPDATPRQILEGESGDPNVRPEFIEIQALPNWVVNEVTRLGDVMEDLAHQHEVSNGGVPGRVDAASAIQLLQETDDSVLKDTTHSMNEAIKYGFQQAVSNHLQFGPPTLTFQLNGRDQQTQVMVLHKTKINSEFKVDVETTSGLPQSTAGKWDRILDLWDRQVITDPNRILELLDLAPDNPDLVPDMPDRKQAWFENTQMAAGKVIRPTKYENHAIHRQEHERFIKSDTFRNLPPDDQQIFIFHLEETRQRERERAQEDAEIQMILSGQMVAQPSPPNPGDGPTAPNPDQAPPPDGAAPTDQAPVSPTG